MTETPRSIARHGGWKVWAQATGQLLQDPYRHHVVDGRAGTPDVYLLPPAEGLDDNPRWLGHAAGTLVWVHNIGSFDVTVEAPNSATWTVAAGSSNAFALVSNVGDGTYQKLMLGDPENGAGPTLPTGYRFILDLTQSQNAVNVLERAVDDGYDGTVPALVRVRVRPGVVLGSSSIIIPALDIGGDSPVSGVSWDSGSLIYLHNEGYIAGKGGQGGAGGIGGTGASTGFTGGNGGIGLQATAIHTRILNTGVIQGGGGGGGGGSGYSSTAGLNGGGGGGGAGADIQSSGIVIGGLGGNAPTGAVSGINGSLHNYGTYGVGSIVAPDEGGHGGIGGTPGASGNEGLTLNNASGLANAGAGGPSFIFTTAIGYVVLPGSSGAFIGSIIGI